MRTMLGFEIGFVHYDSLSDLKKFTDWNLVNLVTDRNQLSVFKGYLSSKKLLMLSNPLDKKALYIFKNVALKLQDQYLFFHTYDPKVFERLLNKEVKNETMIVLFYKD